MQLSCHHRWAYSAFPPSASRRSLWKDWNCCNPKANTANKVSYFATILRYTPIKRQILTTPIQSCSMLAVFSTACRRWKGAVHIASIATVLCLPTCVNLWSSCKGAYAKALAGSASLLALMKGADNINSSLIAFVKPQLTLDTNHTKFVVEKKGEYKM